MVTLVDISARREAEALLRRTNERLESRVAERTAELQASTERLRERVAGQSPAPRVRLSFLEFMQPGLIEAGAELAASGCLAVEVVPLFLGAGGHVRKDLPALLARLQEAHPGVRFTLRPAVGEAAALVDAMATVALDSTRPEIACPTSWIA